MANSHPKCSLRFLLEKHLGNQGGFESINSDCEVTKNLLLDNIIKEINDVRWLNGVLQTIEKEPNMYTRYFQLQIIVRSIVNAFRDNSYSQLFNRDGSVKDRPAVQTLLHRVVSEMENTSKIHKLAK